MLLRFFPILRFSCYALGRPNRRVHSSICPSRAERSKRTNLQGESSKGENRDGAKGGTELASGTSESWWLNWGSDISCWLWTFWGLGGRGVTDGNVNGGWGSYIGGLLGVSRGGDGGGGRGSHFGDGGLLNLGGGGSWGLLGGGGDWGLAAGVVAWGADGFGNLKGFGEVVSLAGIEHTWGGSSGDGFVVGGLAGAGNVGDGTVGLRGDGVLETLKLLIVSRCSLN